jgi:hypothetical protein
VAKAGRDHQLCGLTDDPVPASATVTLILTGGQTAVSLDDVHDGRRHLDFSGNEGS